MKKLKVITKSIAAMLFFTAVLSISIFAQQPQTAKDWLELGNKQIEQEQYDQAIDSFTECIRLDKTVANCFANRGDSYNAVWDEKQDFINIALATADYSKYISLKPNDADVYRKRAAARRELFFGVNSYTISDLKMVLKLNPNDKELVDQLAEDSAEYQKLYKTQQCKKDRGKNGFQGHADDEMMHPLNVYLDLEMTPNNDEFLKALACGANVNFYKKRTKTPFFSDFGDLRLEHLIGILEAGVKIEAKDKKGNTPLMQTLSQIIAKKYKLDDKMLQRISLVEMYGANINAKNRKGETVRSLEKKADFKLSQ